MGFFGWVNRCCVGIDGRGYGKRETVPTTFRTRVAFVVRNGSANAERVCHRPLFVDNENHERRIHCLADVITSDARVWWKTDQKLSGKSRENIRRNFSS